MTGNSADRLVLFIDAQNVYKGARDAFFPEGDSPSTDGQVDPKAVAQLIADRQTAGGYPCEVKAVYIFTGYHTPARNNKAYAAYQAQKAKWESDGCVVYGRPLRYPRNAEEDVQEKGIDVALAIEFVKQALNSEFDVGVLFSTDTDLLPALEFVRDKYGTSIRIQAAAWRSETSVKRLTMQGLYCHALKLDDYESVHDPWNYAPESTEEMAARLTARFSRPPNSN